MLPELNFQGIKPKIQNDSGHTKVWDSLRKKWIKNSPEEWVRQHLILYLLDMLGYPSETLSVEKEFTVFNTKKRFDLLIFRKGKAHFLFECKAPDVPLNQKVLEQALRYNIALDVPFLGLTNGLQHYCVSKNEKGNWEVLDHFPSYEGGR